MTAPHESAAKTEKYRASGGMGRATAVSVADVDDPYGIPARGRKDANTRETT